MIEKIFKAYDVRATYPNPLNEEMAWRVGHATGQFLKRSRQNLSAEQKVKMEDTVVVGRDMRPSSPRLAGSVTEGLRSTGMNVIDVGMVDTSFIYFAINHLDAVGGIMTTASHNPINYNGFEITGRFVHDPNPLVEANLAMLKQKMAEVPVDFGACFDGDADRAMFLDEKGGLVGSDMITALLAKEFLSRQENKGATIVYDLRP